MRISRKLFPTPIAKALALDLNQSSNVDYCLENLVDDSNHRQIQEYWAQALINRIKKDPKKNARALRKAYENNHTLVGRHYENS